MLKFLAVFLYSGLSTMFYQSSSPAAMVLCLLSVTLAGCVILSMSGLFWFSYILFLVFVGGVLILFGYASSLAPNPKFYPSLKSLILSTGGGLAATLLSLSLDSKSVSGGAPLEMGGFMYTSGVDVVTLFMIVYLLLMLVAVVKVSSSMGGSLRGLK